jgi:hypothetical protein
VSADPNIRKFLDEKALAHTFDLRRQLRAVDAIFRRVFGADTEATAISSGTGNASNTR